MTVARLGEARPLCFLHIAKTGGTSFTDAMARFFPPDRVFSDAGNITVDYLERIGNQLSGPAFITGHPGPGVADYLSGRADMITLLRRPVDQAVSNYLHVLADPANDMHACASRMSFSDFLRANPTQISFQSRAICVMYAGNRGDIDPIVQGRLDIPFGFIESLPFVGVIERAETCCDVLSGLLPAGWSVQLPALNSAVYRGVSTRTLRRLRGEYQALREDPSLACLFAVEALMYAKAEAVLHRLSQELAARARQEGAAARDRFVAAGRFSMPGGRQEGEARVCSLVDPAAHLIHGPRYRLSPGHHAVEFHVSPRDAADGGRIEIEALANGGICLAKRWLSVARPLSRADRTLAFRAARDDVLEFRVRARGCGSGELAFSGVTIRSSAPSATWPSAVRRLFAGSRARAG